MTTLLTRFQSFFLFFVIVFVLLKPVRNEKLQFLMTSYGNGFDFVPANPIEMLANHSNVFSFIACFDRCHHVLRCRTFVHHLTSSFTCRLYEGSVETGSLLIVSSSLQVGIIHYYPSLYKNYQKTCHEKEYHRYMICYNGSWTCPNNHFWNGSMCINARYYRSPCSTNVECRSDVGLRCDPLAKICVCNTTAYWNETLCYTNCTATNHSSLRCRSSSIILSTYVSPIRTSTTSRVVKSLSRDDDWENGTTRRYFDCCKPSCAWPGRAKVTASVKTCAKDGVTVISNNIQSSCTGAGNGYGCINQQPWHINSSLAYGFAAVRLVGRNDSYWCCSCYLLVFTTRPLLGKQMIVQVTNSNADPANTFALQIPGAGWGVPPNNCATQFNITNVWGQQHGGVNNRTDCDALPVTIRSGCYWRFDWFQDAINPAVRFKLIPCPTVLINRTGCQRI